MKRLLAIACLALLSGFCALAYAQQQLEIIPLKARSVEQVLPVLRPLLEPGATLSGMNNQLFLRASSRNRNEIKRALAAIDSTPRKLMIYVSQQRGSDETEGGGAVAGQVVLGSKRRVDAKASVWDTRSQRQESNSQMVQTIEGGQALIQIGRALAIPLRQVVLSPAGVIVSESVIYRDIGQGFYAEPKLSGQQLTLEISQQADTPLHDGHGSAQVQRLSTTVSGRLGEWIELGGSGRQARADARGGLDLSSGDLRDNRSIWLKVEEIK